MKLRKLLTIAITVLAALVFSSITTFAQVRVDNLTPDELNTVSQNYFRAAQEGDVRHLSDVMSPEFQFIDEHGLALARASCAPNMAEILKGIDTNQTFQTDRIKVNGFGVKDVQTLALGNMVIETMQYSDNITVQPRLTRDVVTFNRDLRWTNVWTKTEDSYKVVLTQLSPMTKDSGHRAGVGNAPACAQATASISLLPLAVATLVIPSSLLVLRRRRRTKR